MEGNIIQTYLKRPINGVPLSERLAAIGSGEDVDPDLLLFLRELQRFGVQLVESTGTMVLASKAPDLNLEEVPVLPPRALNALEYGDLTAVDRCEARVASLIGPALHALSGARNEIEVEHMLRGFGEEITAILGGKPIEARTERLNSLRQLAGRRDACDVRVVIEGTLMAKANVHRLYAALVNLIKNADNVFKQNERRGNVEVRVRTEGKHIVITVTDNAGGIPDDIWENLWTGGKSGTGGTATGLRDVKKSLAGWADVSAEQRVTWQNGTGARFDLRLEAVPHGTDFSFLKERPISPNLILVVDDHPTSRLVIERMLTRVAPNCEILVAKSVEDAANQMRGRPDAPRLVLTDDEMPGELGSDMALKMREANTDIKIVITSANRERADLDAMQELGLQTLPKPVAVKKASRSCAIRSLTLQHHLLYKKVIKE